MPTKQTAPSGPIYQLKITLRGSKPPIWRRVLVPGSFSLAKLHRVIQLAMGWSDSHLHQFDIGGHGYGIPHPDDWVQVADERRQILGRLGLKEKNKFFYQYDFGDDWQHAITVEKILEPAAEGKYPICTGGKRACPPEDVGGVWGYGDFLAALADPGHEEHESYKEWAGEDFDPERCDLDAINKVLRRVK
ncbi:MAG: plasmid pRiA4b ORF-3 family protein [Thermodesulfobacteriota bacterium]